jgi:hypothetical protein
MKNSNDIDYRLQQSFKINRIDDEGFSEQILTRIQEGSERQRKKSEAIVTAVMFLIFLCSAVWFVLTGIGVIELSIYVATLMLTAVLSLEHQLE